MFKSMIILIKTRLNSNSTGKTLAKVMFFHDYSKFSHQYFVVLNNIHTFAVKKESFNLYNFSKQRIIRRHEKFIFDDCHLVG